MKPLAGGPESSLSHCRAHHKNGDPNNGLFSRPRLTVNEREHGLLLGDLLYLASFIIIFAASPGLLAMIHICDPSAVPSFQMGHSSVVILFVLIVLFYSLPRVPRSPTASLGPRNTYSLRVSRLIRLLLGAPFPVPSISCFFLYYETVGTAAGTVPQGSCHWFVNGESAGLTFSSFDSPLVGSVLSRCWCFTLRCLFFLGLAVLADASAAFAIVSHPNRIQIFYFTAQSA